jgi:hypothetical protein
VGLCSYLRALTGGIVQLPNAPDHRPLIANRTAIGYWEEFDLIHD